MYARIVVPLRYDLAAPVSDEHIRDKFKALGYETQYDQSKIDTATQKIRIGEGAGEREVEIGCTDHHRDLGCRNLKDAPPTIREEIGRFGLFAGASTLHRGNIFVTRVNAGEITIWCGQATLDGLMPLCNRMVEILFEPPLAELIDARRLRKNASNNFSIISGSVGGVVSNGRLNFARVLRMISSRTSDVALLLLTFLVYSATFSLHFVPTRETVQNGKTIKIDPLGETVRAFVENTWPPSLVALLTIILTLSVAYFVTPKKQIGWDWNERAR